MARMRASVSLARCELAVDGTTRASRASSVAVNAVPLMSAVSMRARAGSATSAATRAMSMSVDDENQLAIVIAVLHANVPAAVVPAGRAESELAGLRLIESLDHAVILFDQANAGIFEGASRGGSVGEEKVRDAVPHAAAFDAHAGAAERFTHFRKCAGTIVELNAEIFHAHNVIAARRSRFDRDQTIGDSTASSTVPLRSSFPQPARMPE